MQTLRGLDLQLRPNIPEESLQIAAERAEDRDNGTGHEGEDQSVLDRGSTRLIFDNSGKDIPCHRTLLGCRSVPKQQKHTFFVFVAQNLYLPKVCEHSYARMYADAIKSNPIHILLNYALATPKCHRKPLVRLGVTASGCDR
jgi:hypothetical protein